MPADMPPRPRGRLLVMMRGWSGLRRSSGGDGYIIVFVYSLVLVYDT